MSTAARPTVLSEAEQTAFLRDQVVRQLRAGLLTTDELVHELTVLKRAGLPLPRITRDSIRAVLLDMEAHEQIAQTEPETWAIVRPGQRRATQQT